MKSCKLNNNKGLERFVRNKKEKRIIIGAIIGILLILSGIKLYKTYAVYEEKTSFTILKGQIPDFSADVKLAYTINGVKSNNAFPNKPSEIDKYKAEVECKDGVIAEWNNNLWALSVINSNNQNKISCNINFITKYKESILNGADPVLAEGLVPVTIDTTGKVYKASIGEKWYSYAEKQWANAVILVSNPSKTYNDGNVIDEKDIESYFVWIPKYRYKLWTVSETIGKGSNKEIEIEFGLTNTVNSTTECVTPGWTESTKTYDGSNVSGAIGSCGQNKWMTHPAFLAFNTNGIWVGKFETGYKGSTSTATAQVNSADQTKIQIKPDVNSWRNITMGNIFNVSKNYKPNLKSHLMKNTEWGAMAYLTSSKYGRCDGSGNCTEVTLNSYSAYVTGRNGTTAYSNSSSQGGSTTGNRSGVYDTNGGAWEYVVGYRVGTNGGSSGLDESTITSAANAKYIDKYNTNSSITSLNYGILGDATKEMGKFGTCKGTDRCGDWYSDFAQFVDSNNPWFFRGGPKHDDAFAGTFAFREEGGGDRVYVGFRISLAFNN